MTRFRPNPSDNTSSEKKQEGVSGPNVQDAAAGPYAPKTKVDKTFMGDSPDLSGNASADHVDVHKLVSGGQQSSPTDNSAGPFGSNRQAENSLRSSKTDASDPLANGVAPNVVHQPGGDGVRSSGPVSQIVGDSGRLPTAIPNVVPTEKSEVAPTPTREQIPTQGRQGDVPSVSDAGSGVSANKDHVLPGPLGRVDGPTTLPPVTGNQVDRQSPATDSTEQQVPAPRLSQQNAVTGDASASGGTQAPSMDAHALSLSDAVKLQGGTDNLLGLNNPQNSSRSETVGQPSEGNNNRSIVSGPSVETTNAKSADSPTFPHASPNGQSSEAARYPVSGANSVESKTASSDSMRMPSIYDGRGSNSSSSYLDRGSNVDARMASAGGLSDDKSVKGNLLSDRTATPSDKALTEKGPLGSNLESNIKAGSQIGGGLGSSRTESALQLPDPKLNSGRNDAGTVSNPDPTRLNTGRSDVSAGQLTDPKTPGGLDGKLGGKPDGTGSGRGDIPIGVLPGLPDIFGGTKGGRDPKGDQKADSKGDPKTGPEGRADTKSGVTSPEGKNISEEKGIKLDGSRNPDARSGADGQFVDGKQQGGSNLVGDGGGGANKGGKLDVVPGRTDLDGKTRVDAPTGRVVDPDGKTRVDSPTGRVFDPDGKLVGNRSETGKQPVDGRGTPGDPSAKQQGGSNLVDGGTGGKSGRLDVVPGKTDLDGKTRTDSQTGKVFDPDGKLVGNRSETGKQPVDGRGTPGDPSAKQQGGSNLVDGGTGGKSGRLDVVPGRTDLDGKTRTDSQTGKVLDPDGKTRVDSPTGKVFDPDGKLVGNRPDQGKQTGIDGKGMPGDFGGKQQGGTNLVGDGGSNAGRVGRLDVVPGRTDVDSKIRSDSQTGKVFDPDGKLVSGRTDQAGIKASGIDAKGVRQPDVDNKGTKPADADPRVKQTDTDSRGVRTTDIDAKGNKIQSTDVGARGIRADVAGVLPPGSLPVPDLTAGLKGLGQRIGIGDKNDGVLSGVKPGDANSQVPGAKDGVKTVVTGGAKPGDAAGDVKDGVRTVVTGGSKPGNAAADVKDGIRTGVTGGAKQGDAAADKDGVRTVVTGNKQESGIALPPNAVPIKELIGNLKGIAARLFPPDGVGTNPGAFDNSLPGRKTVRMEGEQVQTGAAASKNESVIPINRSLDVRSQKADEQFVAKNPQFKVIEAKPPNEQFSLNAKPLNINQLDVSKQSDASKYADVSKQMGGAKPQDVSKTDSGKPLDSMKLQGRVEHQPVADHQSHKTHDATTGDAAAERILSNLEIIDPDQPVAPEVEPEVSHAQPIEYLSRSAEISDEDEEVAFDGDTSPSEEEESANRFQYVVEHGDTVELVAIKALNNVALAPLVYEINKDIIPIEMQYGKMVFALKPGSTIWLPFPGEIKSFLERGGLK